MSGSSSSCTVSPLIRVVPFRKNNAVGDIALMPGRDKTTETEYPFKLGLISGALPPAPFAQAVVLDRLLRDVPAVNYCLVTHQPSRKASPELSGEGRLPGRYYILKEPFQLPLVKGITFPQITINTLWGIFRRARQIEGIARRENLTVLIACTADLYDIPAAYLAGSRLNIPFIPYIFDYFSYQWTGFFRFFSRRMEAAILPRAYRTIVTNERMGEEYRRAYGIECSVIYNPCSLPDLSLLDTSAPVFPSKGVHIVFAGTVYHAHFDAFRNFMASLKALGRDDVFLHIYTPQARSQLEKNGICGPMIEYHQALPHTEIPSVLRQAHVLYLPLAFDSPIPEVIMTASPGKTGEYLSVGRPILVHAPEGSFISRYFSKNGCGVVVDRNDIQNITAGLRKIIEDEGLRSDVGHRARIMAQRDFSAAEGSRRFIALLSRTGMQKERA